MINILVVDDELDISLLISDILRDEGHNVILSHNVESALTALANNKIDIAILDIWLDDHCMNGIGLLKVIKKDYEKIQVIMISGHATPETAVIAIRHRAYDFIEKPFKSEKLILTVRRAIESLTLLQIVSENDYNTLLANAGLLPDKNSQQIKKIKEIAELTNSKVFITGEVGTGKANVAKAIHNISRRKHGNFVHFRAFNKSEDEINDSLFLSNNKSISALEKAEYGTLFIDEITNIPIPIQKKLLSFIEKELEGNSGSLRFIVSTAYDVNKAVKDGALDSSLYSRLAIQNITLKSLKERKEDIGDLADYFIQSFCISIAKNPLKISKEVYSIFLMYDWYGNVMELKNLSEFLVIASIGDTNTTSISHSLIPHNILNCVKHLNDKYSLNEYMYKKSYKDAKDEFEKRFLSMHLDNFKWNILKTAEFLGLDRTVLHRKMSTLGLKKP